MTPQERFRYWFTRSKGYPLQFYNGKVGWEGDVYEEPHYFTDAITGHAIDCLKQDHEVTLLPFSLATRSLWVGRINAGNACESAYRVLL